MPRLCRELYLRCASLSFGLVYSANNDNYQILIGCQRFGEGSALRAELLKLPPEVRPPTVRQSINT
jgi:hypothetical protein